MSKPTWGVYIPGYSSPSVKQEKLFNKMYPGRASEIRKELERNREEAVREQNKLAEKERQSSAECLHSFVPTNVNNGYVCKKCRTYATLYKGE